MSRSTNRSPNPSPEPDLRERVLADFQALRVPLTAAQLDDVLTRAEKEGLSHLVFLHALIAEQAQIRRERSIAHRIREANFREPKTLATFDWSRHPAAYAAGSPPRRWPIKPCRSG